MYKLNFIIIFSTFFAGACSALQAETKVYDFGDGGKATIHKPSAQEIIQSRKERRDQALNTVPYEIVADNPIPSSEYDQDGLSAEDRIALLETLGSMRGSDSGAFSGPGATQEAKDAMAAKYGTDQTVEPRRIAPNVTYENAPTDDNQRDRWLIHIALTEKTIDPRKLKNILRILADSDSDIAEDGIEKINRYADILAERAVRHVMPQRQIDKSGGIERFKRKHSNELKERVIRNVERRIQKGRVKNRDRMIALISQISTETESSDVSASAESSLTRISDM